MWPLLLLLSCLFLTCSCKPWSFIPGESCGIANAIRTLEEFPKDFDGDLTSFACTYILDNTNWVAYQASLTAEETQGEDQTSEETPSQTVDLGTTVPDGFVLVLGGFIIDGNQKANTAEIVDLSKADSGCAQLPSLPIPTGVSDGTLGYYDDKLLHCNQQDCHSYEPGASEWTALSDTMSTSRYAPASSIIQNVWLISGGSDSIKSTEYWDGTQFHDGPEMPNGMSYHCQVTISVTEVFFHSTRISVGDANGRTFILDWDQKTWTTLQEGTSTWSAPTCGRVKSSSGVWEIVVADRGESSIFNLQSETWRDGPSITPWTSMVATVQLQETVVIAGGKISIPGVSERSDLVMMYDAESEEFVQLDYKLHLARSRATGIAVPANFCQ